MNLGTRRVAGIVSYEMAHLVSFDRLFTGDVDWCSIQLDTVGLDLDFYKVLGTWRAAKVVGP